RLAWEQSFGFSPIGLDQNFFDIGGHSLLAIAIVRALEEISGRSLPLSTVFQAPTIQAQLKLLAEAGFARFSTRITLRDGSRESPLFLLPGFGGNVFEFHRLAHLLRTPRAVIGLQARGLDPHDAPHMSVEAMALDHVETLRQVQPDGPYALAG